MLNSINSVEVIFSEDLRYGECFTHRNARDVELAFATPDPSLSLTFDRCLEGITANYPLSEACVRFRTSTAESRQSAVGPEAASGLASGKWPPFAPHLGQPETISLLRESGEVGSAELLVAVAP